MMKARVIHIITRLELGGAQQNTLYTVEHLDKSRFSAAVWSGDGGLLNDEACFTGDTLFAGSIGRTDLPGGSEDVLFRTLAERIAPLEDALALYPGHGPSTTIAREKERNPFLRMAMGLR